MFEMMDSLAQEPRHSAQRKRLILKCRFEQIPLPGIRCLWAVPQRGWRPNCIKSLPWGAEKGFLGKSKSNR
jgi:hypothetical protein